MSTYSHKIKAFLFAILFFLMPLTSRAQEQTEQQPDVSYTAEASIGYRHYNVKGYRGKVGEYDTLDSGAEAGFNLQGRAGSKYFDFTGEIFDKRDQSYMLNVDVDRITQFEFSYRRFRHFLDNDPLTNQDFYTNFDADMDNGITLEEIKAYNTVRIPAVPFLKFTADYRRYSKRGHRQATTVAKCSQCHVSSRNKRINAHTDDVTLGLEGRFGPATISYQHLWRSFKEDGAAPLTNYGNGAPSFRVRGRALYSRVPDSKTRIHKINVNSKLPFASALFASYQWGERSNRDTRNEIDFNNFAARLSKIISRYFSADVFYSSYHMDNNAPDAMDRDIERGGFNIKARPLKRTGLKFTYQWEMVDRNNYTETSTYKKIYRVSLNRRVSRSFRLHLRYQKTKIDDPFILKDKTFRRLVQTALPRNEDEIYVAASWSPRPNFSLNTNLLYINSQHSHYDVDEDRYEFVISLWYMPFERMTLTGTFTLIDAKVDTPATFKTYHAHGLDSLFLFDEVPYDDRSRSYYMAVSYQLNPRLSLTGDIAYTASNADFDVRLDSQNVGDLSDLDIDQLETSLGIIYLYNKRLVFYAKYMYREYDDREVSDFDGQFSLISFGMSWSF